MCRDILDMLEVDEQNDDWKGFVRVDAYLYVVPADKAIQDTLF